MFLSVDPNLIYQAGPIAILPSAVCTSGHRRGLPVDRFEERASKQVRTFGTTTRELMGLGEWLLSGGCTRVAVVARKLAVLLHKSWVSKEIYEPVRNNRNQVMRRRRMRSL